MPAACDETLAVVDCSDAMGGMASPEGIFAKIEQRLRTIAAAAAE